MQRSTTLFLVTANFPSPFFVAPEQVSNFIESLSNNNEECNKSGDCRVLLQGGGRKEKA